MNDNEKAILSVLHSIAGIGNRSLWKIKEEFKSFEYFYKLSDKEIFNYSLSDKVKNEIVYMRKKINPLEELDKIKSRNIDILVFDDSLYPSQLRNIYNSPYLLYYRGDINLLNNPSIAVVGSRTPSHYGKQLSEQFSIQLCQKNLNVVSGMARGIDSIVHKSVLEHGGKTIAVLGSGLEQIYPPENKRLFYEIAEKGLVLSEFNINMKPEARNFPMRNRIISGLSLGVLVIEAKEKSGALITADFALEQGRDVFAIPGPITSPTSAGTNSLIKQGAKLVSSIEDILEEYEHIMPQNIQVLEQEELLLLDNDENLVIQCIGYELMHFDEIIEKTAKDIGKLSAILLQLEIKGIIQVEAGNYYQRSK